MDERVADRSVNLPTFRTTGHRPPERNRRRPPKVPTVCRVSLWPVMAVTIA